MNRFLIGFVFFGATIIGCTTEPEVTIEEIEVTRIVEQTVEVTRIVEKEVIVTASPIPATPTITPTRIPYDVSACVPLVVNGDFLNEDYILIENNIEQYEERCIKVYVTCLTSGNCFIHDSTLMALEYANWILDDETPEDFPGKFEEAWIWGFVDISNGTDKIKIIVREYSLLPENQFSLQRDGTYSVGEEARMAPGAWVNGIPVGAFDDCYWERLDKNGDTIDNHYGTTGTTVRVREGEVFITEGCSVWYYWGP